MSELTEPARLARILSELMPDNESRVLSHIAAQADRIRELEAIVRRFVVFDPYPDSTLTKDARVLLAGLRRDRGGEHG